MYIVRIRPEDLKRITLMKNFIIIMLAFMLFFMKKLFINECAIKNFAKIPGGQKEFFL